MPITRTTRYVETFGWTSSGNEQRDFPSRRRGLVCNLRRRDAARTPAVPSLIVCILHAFGFAFQLLLVIRVMTASCVVICRSCSMAMNKDIPSSSDNLKYPLDGPSLQRIHLALTTIADGTLSDERIILIPKNIDYLYGTSMACNERECTNRMTFVTLIIVPSTISFSCQIHCLSR